MGMPYWMDLRERVVATVLQGGSSKAAAQFAIAVSAVVIWCGAVRIRTAWRRARWTTASRRLEYSTVDQRRGVPTPRHGDLVIVDTSAAAKAKPSARPSAPRRQADLPAQILPRPEPDRAGLRRAHTSLAQGDRSNDRVPDRGSRRTPQCLHR